MPQMAEPPSLFGAVYLHPLQLITSLSILFEMPESDVTIRAVFEPFGDERLITVERNNSEWGEVWTSELAASPGTEVFLSAFPSDGMMLETWEVLAGNVAINNPNSADTSFVMPSGLGTGESITIRAVFQELIATPSSLNEAIAEAESRIRENYTSASWTNLYNALRTARTVRDNERATQVQIDATADTLWAAIDALAPAPVIPEPGVDRTALIAAITESDSRTQSNYTVASWTALHNALRTATTVRDNPNATQAQIDATERALRAALDGLVPVPVIPAPSADRTALITAIEDAESRVQSDYTTASWTRMANALRTARTVYGNANATQAQIDAVTNALMNAINTLVTA